MGGGINSVMGYHSMLERSPGLGLCVVERGVMCCKLRGKLLRNGPFLCMILTITDTGVTCDIGWPSTQWLASSR